MIKTANFMLPILYQNKKNVKIYMEIKWILYLKKFTPKLTFESRFLTVTKT